MVNFILKPRDEINKLVWNMTTRFPYETPSGGTSCPQYDSFDSNIPLSPCVIDFVDTVTFSS